jgi:predicted kinase
MSGFVLVGGWPAAGKTTLARPLASELQFAYLSKDDLKEALMDVLGAPSTVEASRDLGRAAVAATLRGAKGCRPAVIDSTWFPSSLSLVQELQGPFVEIRCHAPIDVVRRRYQARVRDDRHLDHLRTEDELWGCEVAPLGVGPLLEVDTEQPADLAAVAQEVRLLLESADNR